MDALYTYVMFVEKLSYLGYICIFKLCSFPGKMQEQDVVHRGRCCRMQKNIEKRDNVRLTEELINLLPLGPFSLLGHLLLN
jgi:hypothetical protein